MKQRILLFLLALLFMTGAGRARPLHCHDLDKLMSDAHLIFAGQVKSIRMSDHSTRLSYPTYKNSAFGWQMVAVEVLVPFKGVKKGEVVRTLMLARARDALLLNPPGTIEPKADQSYLFFLVPTSIEGVFASITEPWDGNQAAFLLDRADPEYAIFREDGDFFVEQDPLFGERYELVFRLVGEKGNLLPDGATFVRKKYASELNSPGDPSAVVALSWKTKTGAGGWQWDIPDDQGVREKPGSEPKGPVTKRLGPEPRVGEAGQPTTNPESEGAGKQ